MKPMTRSTVRMRDRLVFRFAFFVGLGLLAVASVSAYFGARNEQASRYAGLQRQAEQLTHLLAASSSDALFTFELNALGGIVTTFSKDPSVRLLGILDKDDKVLKSTGDLAQRNGLVISQEDVKAGSQVVGKVVVGLSDEPVREAVANAWKMLLLREGIGLIVLFSLLAWLLRREVTRPLGGEPADAINVANRIAAGDFTVDVQVQGNDTSSLLYAMKNMQQNLSSIVGQINQAAGTIEVGAKEIASGNADLSSRTEEQASSLEETASSIEELTSTVKQNTENAKQANQLAASASEVAVKGGQVVSQVVTTMSSINDASKKIADIIGVIDGIAFQTNILALNAAVEAARAGEQGRGFAVVATEVRNLAQRSAAAAKEIKELISDSVGKVEDGTKLVDEAGKTMGEIVASVKRVTDVMAEIAAASQEQSSGIEQVNQAITQMDEATQRNAALVEEAAAAAESMQEQAQNLGQAVAVFKLAQHEEHAAVQAEKPVASVTHLPAKKPAAKPAAKTGVEKPAARKVANAKQGDGEWEEF